jgi:hypothetical protein
MLVRIYCHDPPIASFSREYTHIKDLATGKEHILIRRKNPIGNRVEPLPEHLQTKLRRAVTVNRNGTMFTQLRSVNPFSPEMKKAAQRLPSTVMPLLGIAAVGATTGYLIN